MREARKNVKISNKDLNFKWTRDNNVLGDNSGKGQSSIIVSSIIPVRDINIQVEILDNLGNTMAINSKLITKNDPDILFYENSPLYGILYNKAIATSYYLGTKEELTIVAKPFSFSFLNDVAVEAIYKWYVNGVFVSPSAKTNELILRQTTAGTKGTASVLLDLKNINKINQYTTRGFNVEFGL